MKKGASHLTPFPLFSKIQNSTSDFLQSPSGAFSQFFPTSLDLVQSHKEDNHQVWHMRNQVPVHL